MMSVSCSLVVACWERADLLAFLYVMFSCVMSLAHILWYLVVWIPDLCILPYFQPIFYTKSMYSLTSLIFLTNGTISLH